MTLNTSGWVLKAQSIKLLSKLKCLSGHTWNSVEFWSPLHRRVVGGLDKAVKTGKPAIWGKASLRELGLYSLEKRRLRGNLMMIIMIFWYLKCSCPKKVETPFLQRAEAQVILRWFQLDTRGKFFTMRTVSHCNNVFREVAVSPTLGIWTPEQGAVPSFLDCVFAKKGSTRWSSRSSSKLKAWVRLSKQWRKRCPMGRSKVFTPNWLVYLCLNSWGKNGHIMCRWQMCVHSTWYNFSKPQSSYVYLCKGQFKNTIVCANSRKNRARTSSK